MKYLGVDFGLKHLGLAIASSPLAEPLNQYHYQSTEQALSFLTHLIHEQQINIIVLGLPEGQLKSLVRQFGQQLTQAAQLPVFYQDETLSTYEAKQRLLSAKKPQSKRRQDHQAAAAIILQNYLDEHYQD